MTERSTGAWVGDDNAALLTDFYEITMAASYHARGLHHEATFDLFVRHLPPNRQFLVAAGLETALGILNGIRYSARSLAYLRSLGMFDDGFLDYLGGFRFTGDVLAIPEGEVAFPNEPILRVTAPLPEAQLVETFLLNTIGFQTMIASKAARIALASGDRRFVDFSPRRDHGADSALKGARAAYIGGAAATSLTLAGELFGLPVTGTMAHSYVTSFDDETDAFRTFARQFPDNAVLLIDTYDTEEGARRAAAVAHELWEHGIRLRGVRLDSGDLMKLSHAVRRILDDAGLGDVQIFASGDLDEYRISEMVGAGCPVDAFGVGTRLGTSSDAPYLGVVYKLVDDVHGPKMKLSTEKANLPGRKQVYRFAEFDVIALEEETLAGGRPLLTQVMKHGEVVAASPSLDELQANCRRAIAALPERLRTIHGEERPYEVRRSPGLEHLIARTATRTG